MSYITISMVLYIYIYALNKPVYLFGTYFYDLVPFFSLNEFTYVDEQGCFESKPSHYLYVCTYRLILQN
jgi:hypothetical protein